MLPTPVPPSPSERAIPKVLFKGRMVSGKKSNSPFFVHQRHKQSRSIDRCASPPSSLAQKPPPHPHPLLHKTLALCFSGFRYSLLVLLLSIVLSRMITENWLWGYTGKWARLSQYFPGPQETFTVERLALHDGVRDPTRPLLLAINGVVYNVDANPAMYGPGGAYHHFAGRDASRAFVTGCFKSGLTHDLRGLTPRQKNSLEYWRNFFENSSKYPRVGSLILPDLDQSDVPIPTDCDPKTEGGAL